MEQDWTVEIFFTNAQGAQTRLVGRLQQNSSVALEPAPRITGPRRIGQQLACDAVASPPTAELAYQWTRASEAIAGATARTYWLAPEDDGALVGCLVTARSSGSEISMEAPAVEVTFAPPTLAEPIGPRTYTLGTGTQTVEAGDAFAGEGLRYDISAAGTTVDPVTGRVSIPTDVLATEVEVAVTATNSGGAATATFPVSVVAPNALHVAVNGSDDADGGPTTPVASLARAVELAGVGQTIRLRRGDTWREVLTPTKDGLRIDAYGSGDLPVISGADPVMGLTSGEEHEEFASAGFERGDLSELAVTISADSAPVASTDAARSGTYAMRITSNGSDGRSMGAIEAPTAQGETERRYVFAFNIAQAAVKAGSQLRLLRLSAGGTHHVYLSLRWDASRTFTTWDLNNHSSNAFLSNNAPVIGVNWGEWNTVELRLVTGGSGAVSLIVNGIEQISLTGDYSHANLAAINRMYVGADAFGAGLASSAYAYFDDMGITGPDTIGIWTASLADNPPQIFIDGTRGRRMSSADEVTAAGRWHWAAGTLTVYGDAEPQIEASARDTAVSLGSRSGVSIRNVRVERTGRTGILADDASGFTVENAEIAECYVSGISSSSENLRTGVRISSNTVTDCGGTGISFGGRLADWNVDGNTVERCATLTQGVVGSGDGREATFEWTAGIKIWGWGADGWCGAYAIRDNIVRNCGPETWALGIAATHGQGIWADEVLAPTARPEISGNIVSGCWSRGIYLEKTDDHDVFANLVYSCARQQYSASIQVDSNQYGYDVVLDQAALVPRQVAANRVVRNTAVGGWWAFAAVCVDGGCSLSGTEVEDNVFCGSGGSPGEIYLAGGGSNDGTHGTGNAYRFNNWGTEGGGKVWGGAVHAGVAAFQAASGGAVSNSIVGDPAFVDAAADNYGLDAGSPCIGNGSEGGNIGHTG